MKTTLVATLLLCEMLVLGGCASADSSQADRGPYVKPGLIMLTADQARARGIKVAPAPGQADEQVVQLPAEVEAMDTTAVTVPAGVKVYTMNRSVDPADPDIMHEEHAVYRRETAPQWRLNPPASQKIMVGPRVTDGQQDLKPLLDKELTTFLNDQRKVTQSNQQAISALFQAVDALNRQQQAILRHELEQKSSAAGAAAEDHGSKPTADKSGADKTSTSETKK